MKPPTKITTSAQIIKIPRSFEKLWIAWKAGSGQTGILSDQQKVFVASLAKVLGRKSGVAAKPDSASVKYLSESRDKLFKRLEELGAQRIGDDGYILFRGCRKEESDKIAQAHKLGNTFALTSAQPMSFTVSKELAISHARRGNGGIVVKVIVAKNDIAYCDSRDVLVPGDLEKEREVVVWFGRPYCIGGKDIVDHVDPGVKIKSHR